MKVAALVRGLQKKQGDKKPSHHWRAIKGPLLHRAKKESMLTPLCLGFRGLHASFKNSSPTKLLLRSY